MCEKAYFWHYRLSHIGTSRLQKLYNEECLGAFNFKSFLTYEFCLMDKLLKSLSTRHEEHVKDILELIHTNV